MRNIESIRIHYNEERKNCYSLTVYYYNRKFVSNIAGNDSDFSVRDDGYFEDHYKSLNEIFNTIIIIINEVKNL